MKKNEHDNALSSLSAVSQASRLVRRKASPMALEQRFMFDGAAVVEATAVLSSDHQGTQASTAWADAAPETTAVGTDVTDSATAPTDSTENVPLLVIDSTGPIAISNKLQAGLDQALQTLENWAASPNAANDMADVFAPQQDNISAVLNSVRTGEATVTVELRDQSDLLGAMGAFAASGPGGSPVIYLNRDWVNHTATTPDAIAAVALEEYGHYLDTLLNSDRDTVGDEGALFSAKLTANVLESATLQRTLSADDSAMLTVDGVAVSVEQATTDFIDANFAPFDFSVTSGTDQRIAGSANSAGETWLYQGVLTVGSQTVDAIVKLVSITGGTMSAFDSTSQPYNSTRTWQSAPNTSPKFLQPNFTWNSTGGSATFSVSFILGGSYNASTNPTGTAVTLRNVAVNSYDLDSTSTSSTGAGGNQYTSFTNVGGLELSSSTALVTSVSEIGRAHV